jgi:hypothetical protein
MILTTSIHGADKPTNITGETHIVERFYCRHGSAMVDTEWDFTYFTIFGRNLI